jgi:multiple sugar transport system ATP-binding protein
LPQLSPAQQWLVAFGRAVVWIPKVFLFDDPLSGLDVKTRAYMGKELSETLRRFNAATIYATCDQDEAMISLADRVVVMKEGKIQ